MESCQMTFFAHHQEKLHKREVSLCAFERSFEFVSEITRSNGSIAELSFISIPWQMVQTFDGSTFTLGQSS